MKFIKLTCKLRKHIFKPCLTKKKRFQAAPNFEAENARLFAFFLPHQLYFYPN